MACGLLETLKFGVLELQEHLDTYTTKREAAEQVSLLHTQKSFASDSSVDLDAEYPQTSSSLLSLASTVGPGTALLCSGEFLPRSTVGDCSLGQHSRRGKG